MLSVTLSNIYGAPQLIAAKYIRGNAGTCIKINNIQTLIDVLVMVQASRTSAVFLLIVEQFFSNIFVDNPAQCL